MLRFIIRRLLQAALLLMVMSVVFFTLLHLIPGGPAESIGAQNPHISQAQRHAIAVKYGLDKPLPVQYLVWVGAAVRGDFGYSIQNGQPVLEAITERLPYTLRLFGVALSFALILALLLGVIAAVKQYSLTDYTITVLAYA